MVVKRCSAINRSTSWLPMKFSTLPPTSGMRTSTVVLNSSREPLVAGRQHGGAVQRGGRAADGTLDHRRRLAIDDRPPRLLADETQVAVVELGHHTWQPVGPQRLRRDDVHATVGSELHGIQRRLVRPRTRQPRQPVPLIAESPVDLFDGALVLGCHVERTRHSHPRYRYGPWSVRILGAQRSGSRSRSHR